MARKAPPPRSRKSRMSLLKRLIPGPVKRTLRPIYLALRSRPRVPTASAATRIVSVTTEALGTLFAETLPTARVPASPELIRKSLQSSLRKGRLDEDAKRLAQSYLNQPSTQQSMMLSVVSEFVQPRRFAQLLSIFEGASTQPELQLMIVDKALSTGDLLTAKQALTEARRLSEQQHTPQIILADASYAIHTDDLSSASASLRALLVHPDLTFKDLLRALSLADGSCHDLVVDILARMQSIAKGAHRLTAARHLYEFHPDSELGFKALADLLSDPKLGNNAAYWTGRYLRHAGLLPEANVIFSTLRKTDPNNHRVCLEMAELAVEDDDYRGALRLVEKGRNLSIATKPIFAPAEFTAFASMGKFSTAWALYKKRGSHQHLRDGYLQHRYNSNFQKWSAIKNRILVAVSGLGDEIRWSLGYDKLPHDGGLTITCDPRLYPIFKRSFPSLNFLPVKRRYKVVDRIAGANYEDVPTAELSYFFDSNGWAEALRADAVTTMYDAISSLLPTREAFQRDAPLFEVDTQKVTQWQRTLPTDLPKVALSWRSDLLSYARTQHYLPLDAILAVIRSYSAHWYILQSELSAQERQSIQIAAASGKVTFASDLLDIRNDLDDLAAFLKCMDVTIAPATANLELAGAIGARAILMSRSKHVSWRIQKSNRDLWFPSVVHAQVPLSLDLSGNKLADLVASMIGEILSESVARNDPS